MRRRPHEPVAQHVQGRKTPYRRRRSSAESRNSRTHRPEWEMITKKIITVACMVELAYVYASGTFARLPPYIDDSKWAPCSRASNLPSHGQRQQATDQEPQHGGEQKLNADDLMVFREDVFADEVGRVAVGRHHEPNRGHGDRVQYCSLGNSLGQLRLGLLPDFWLSDLAAAKRLVGLGDFPSLATLAPSPLGPPAVAFDCSGGATECLPQLQVGQILFVFFARFNR